MISDVCCFAMQPMEPMFVSRVTY